MGWQRYSGKTRKQAGKQKAEQATDQGLALLCREPPHPLLRHVLHVLLEGIHIVHAQTSPHAVAASRVATASGFVHGCPLGHYCSDLTRRLCPRYLVVELRNGAVTSVRAPSYLPRLDARWCLRVVDGKLTRVFRFNRDIMGMVVQQRALVGENCPSHAPSPGIAQSSSGRALSAACSRQCGASHSIPAARARLEGGASPTNGKAVPLGHGRPGSNLGAALPAQSRRPCNGRPTRCNRLGLEPEPDHRRGVAGDTQHVRVICRRRHRVTAPLLCRPAQRRV
jgi:hypothetical protein